jgi:hypothetical protein
VFDSRRGHQFSLIVFLAHVKALPCHSRYTLVRYSYVSGSLTMNRQPRRGGALLSPSISLRSVRLDQARTRKKVMSAVFAFEIYFSRHKYGRMHYAALALALALLTSCGGSSTNSGSSTAAPTATLTATPTTITSGQTAMLTFSSTNATSGSINNGVGAVGTASPSQGIPVAPTSTGPITYVYTVTGPGGTATAQATVTVNQAPPPPTVTLTASPTTMLAGVPITLTWSASSSATSVVISASSGNNPGGVQPISGGSVSFLPPVSTTNTTITYTATAYGSNGQTPVTATATVTVNALNSFEGLTANLVTGGTGEDDIDPNGAIGTKQFMEYVNSSYQAYSKTSPYAPVWSSPQPIGTPWTGEPHCALQNIQLDAVVSFDRLASRWLIAAKTTVQNEYYFCIALSNTDDLTSPTFAWYTYYFDISSYLKIPPDDTSTYLPDWPKLGTWWNGYYAAMDMVDNSSGVQTENGALICAFNRSLMLTGNSSGTDNQSLMSCQAFDGPAAGGYLSHSLIPVDVDGTTAPPTGRDEYMVSIENPPLDNSTITSSEINLWDCQLNWNASTPLSCSNTQPAVQQYVPGCYTAIAPALTNCVPEPGIPSLGGLYVDSVGDRFMPRFAYRNFGSYESFFASHTILTGPGPDCTANCGQGQMQNQTGIRWYEFTGSGSGTPTISQQGMISPDITTYRFLPSIAQDSAGNVVVGYSTSTPAAYNPGINVSYWNANDPNGPATTPTEVTILTGEGEEVPILPGTQTVTNAGQWGSYATISVDPTDDCTFWYVNEYWPTTNDLGYPANWATNISYFQVPGCTPTPSGSAKKRHPSH